MKKLAFAFLGLALAASLQAQDIYKMESLSTEDLNGTARFVGMGGAMSALGADLSTMSTNPAGIGLYRTSDASLSASATWQTGAKSYVGRNKTAASFDQAGFVYAMKLDNDLEFFNFGFNYHKKKNSKNYLQALGVKTGGLSQSWQMMDLANYGENLWLDLDNKNDRELTTPLTLLGYDTYMIDPTFDEQGKITDYEPSKADSYDYKRVQWGGINVFDINLSANWKDRIYAGLTIGVYEVDMHSFTDYAEWLINPNDYEAYFNNPAGNYEYKEYFMQNEEKIYGSGFDVKAGIIVRPIEESPFRMGFSVSTPTFYNIRAENFLYMNSPYVAADATTDKNYTDANFATGRYEYKVRTPWKINVSAATTIGQNVALDAEYEFSNLPGAQVRYFEDTYLDYGNSSKDEALCSEADRFLKPQHTLRVGGEVRVEDFYARVGYNFVSSSFKEDAYLNQFTSSPAYYYQTNTDYVNLGDTHRVTCGLGFRMKRVYGDVAYQYQTQSADLYAFHLPQTGSELNRLQKSSSTLERHNVLFTIGCKF